MKCPRCGSWTEVLETRKTDGGHTLKRTRRCGNACKRFVTYEVLAPIYNKDASTVRQTTAAAAARHLQYKRDQEIYKRAQRETHAQIAAEMGVCRQTITKAVRRMQPQGK